MSRSTARGWWWLLGTALASVVGCSTARPTDGSPTMTVDVTPPSLHLVVGDTARFHAATSFDDGEPGPDCQPLWSTGNGAVASVDAAGLVSALSAGSTRVIANCGGRTGESDLTVTGASQSANAIFTDDFDAGALGDAGRWQDVVGSGGTIVTASNEGISARSGTRVLKFGTGGAALTHFVATGSTSPYEQLRLSFWMYRPAAYEAVNSGLRAGGIRGSTTQWGSFGVGWGTPGSCPDDPNNVNQQEFMFAYVFNDGANWALRTYTNWLGQQKLTTNPPTCGGNYALGSGSPPATYHEVAFVPTANAWHRYEIEVRLNDVGQANGWQRMWVDGVLRIEHLNVRYRTTSGMRLWGVTFDTGTIPGGAFYVDGVVVTAPAGTVPPPPAPVATVTVSPASLSLVPGQTGQLGATLRDAAGAVLTGRSVTWSTSASGVATVTGSGLVTAVGAGTATITATSEGRSGTATVTVTTTPPPPPPPGAGAPVYDAANAAHVLHVFEDWSTYATPSAIETTRRVDGGGSWQVSAPSRLSFATTNLDPWFGRKTLTLDYRDAPPAGQALLRGLVLEQGTPARYLNAAADQESLVIEWAWRFSGTAPYVGKIADWQPFPGTDRFNYQNSYDRLGSQQSSSCSSDPLCSLYYVNGAPRFAGLPPSPGQPAGQIARSWNDGSQNLVTFYTQNRNWGDGAGQVNWGGTTTPMIGINFVDNTWRRTILRFTKHQNGQRGYGRIEEWMQRAGEPAVKVMEYVGDLGGFDEGLVISRNAAWGGPGWFVDGAILHFYDLSAVSGNFDGGSLVHLGYFRMWSHPRQ